MEGVQSWPPVLANVTSARYRDNVFAAFQALPSELGALAAALSDLYEMPVKLEGGGHVRRCLELRLCWGANADGGLRLSNWSATDRQKSGSSRSSSLVAWLRTSVKVHRY